jgi:hypothetical protein
MHPTSGGCMYSSSVQPSPHACPLGTPHIVPATGSIMQAVIPLFCGWNPPPSCHQLDMVMLYRRSLPGPTLPLSGGAPCTSPLTLQGLTYGRWSLTVSGGALLALA